MTAKIFIDSNLWIYAYDQRNTQKQQKVRELLTQNLNQVVISTQILGEIYHVLTRKKLANPEQATAIVNDLIESSDMVPIGLTHVRKAIEIQKQTQYSYWDSLVVSTALLNHCELLYSEDMQHNRQIEGLRLLNPFVG